MTVPHVAVTPGTVTQTNLIGGSIVWVHLGLNADHDISGDQIMVSTDLINWAQGTHETGGVRLLVSLPAGITMFYSKTIDAQEAPILGHGGLQLAAS